MIINPHAFKNCKLLTEINFSNINETVYFGFLKNDNIPSTLKIIVKNSMYNQWVKNNPLICQYLIPKSAYIDSKLKNIKLYTIYRAYQCITNAIKLINNDKINNIFTKICSKLYKMYNINNKDYEEFKNLQSLKEQAENE